MNDGYDMRRRRLTRNTARTRVAERPTASPWLALLAGLAVLALGAGVVHGQPVPEVVKPQTDSPTLPPSGSAGPLVQPKSENPLADSGTARPIPDSGVIAPPSSAGATPIIRPPSVGTMPVIPPPGSAGGDKSVIPK